MLRCYGVKALRRYGEEVVVKRQFCFSERERAILEELIRQVKGINYVLGLQIS
ncbi:MAG: hypothetical protein GYA71_05125 [Bacteroidales bacterium]|nr:hypothetical protein [Bacteroidales bacterium]